MFYRRRFGWIKVSATDIPLVIFKGSTIFSPSSTKTEAFALLSALLCCSSNSKINICTDSVNVISTFNHVTNKLISQRRKLKISNYHIWRLIEACNTLKNLEDLYNDIADDLENHGRSLKPITINLWFYKMP
ncbi:unnamed protein product [Rhizophagus irregularis]|nr:unnamed protein product [Rhizophagus irregularis]